MRTTVTLDPNVAARLKKLAHRKEASFKQTINEVLLRGLSLEESGKDGPFVVEPHSGVFRPGIDLGKLNQLADELEIADFVEESRR
ncbi:MAG: DUF2191 domain-containing protein [Deltaproteobacteria bacterium]|nr:DUF2191 domain-containing protein [Deltaproteobacteria bacterium]